MYTGIVQGKFPVRRLARRAQSATYTVELPARLRHELQLGASVSVDGVCQTVAALEERLAHIETPITLSIIGCVVNGPGEALMTDIGLTGGGNGRHMVYAAGKTDHTIDQAGMVNHIVELVEKKAEALKAAAPAKAAAE